MVRITNKHGLPDAIANFAEYHENRKYSRGDADVSVTTLIDSPHRWLLFRKHSDEIERDASEIAPTMLGSALHFIWERGVGFDCIAEERLYAHVGGMKLSGQVDLQIPLPNGGMRVTDFKTSSVWSYIMSEGNVKPEWERQLNCYAALVDLNKGAGTVRELTICCLYRDWSERELMRRKGEYPPQQIMEHAVPLWPMDERMRFLEDRVGLFRDALENPDFAACSDEERWYKPGDVALMKRGNKRATKVAASRDELLEYAASTGLLDENGELKPEYEIVERPGTYARCERWCEVAPWCEQWQREKHDQANEQQSGALGRVANG